MFKFIYVKSILLFLTIFAGDYKLISINISLISSLALLTVVSKLKFHFLGTVLLSLFLLVEIFNGFLFQQVEAYERIQVWFAALFFMTYLNTEKNIESVIAPLIVVSVLFSIAALADFGTRTGRDFIFGPNILYRIIIFPLAVMPLVLGVLLSMIAAYGTLSRGSVLTGALMILSRKIPFKYIIIFSLITPSILFLIVEVLQSFNNLPRFLKFYDSGGSSSISHRLTLLNDLFFNFSLFGNSFLQFNIDFPFIAYPHNIVVEAIYHYGLVGLLFVFFIVYNLMVRVRSKSHASVMLVCLIPCLLSGDMVDNMLYLMVGLFGVLKVDGQYNNFRSV